MRPFGSGIAELDDYVAPVICIMGNLTMRSAEFQVVKSRPTKRYVDWMQTVNQIHSDAVGRHRNLFFEWSLGHDNVEKVYKDLKDMLDRLNCHICVGSIIDPATDESNIVAYIRRTNYVKVPDMTVEGHAPDIFYPVSAGRRQDALTDAITVFSSMVSAAAGDIVVQKSSSNEEAISFHQIMHAVQNLSKLELAMVKGQIKAKTKNEMTNFDHQFLRVLPSVMEIISINDRSAGSMLFNAYDPPFKVCPLDMLINMDQQGTRLKEVVMAEETFALRDPFRKASILENYSVILLGACATTGFGKTQYTLALAIEWVKAYCEFNGNPKDSAMIYMSSAVDPAKSIQFKAGMAWVLDEFHPFDSNQLVHMSETMLKVLLTPQMAGTVRGRSDDVKLVPGVARLISANSNSPEAWCGNSCAWSAPLRRKSICFNISEPLVSDTWRDDVAVQVNGAITGFDAVLATNTTRLQ